MPTITPQDSQQELELHPKIKCCECEELFEEDDVFEHDGEHYCSDCEGENFIVCHHCDEFCCIDDAVEPTHGTWYCSAGCAGEDDWYKCDDCGDWTHIDDSNRNEQQNLVCSSCGEDYSTCSSCRDSFDSDDVHYNEEEGDYYCEGCTPSSSGSGIIKDYSYKPLEYLYDKMPWENTIYLGIELEVECQGNPDDKAEKVMEWLKERKLEDRVYIKHDSSLENGFEIVFHPTTLQAMHKRFPMRLFLQYLKRIELSSYEKGTCGLHVHISKKKMSNRDLWAGKLFFWKCQKELKKFSGRDNFEFCKLDDDMPNDGFTQEYGKYSAFNSRASDDTAEIRIFRGSLEYERFQASLQLSDCFAEYIQVTSVVLLKNKTAEVVWGDFLSFARRSKKYSQLVKYCKKKGIV